MDVPEVPLLMLAVGRVGIEKAHKKAARFSSCSALFLSPLLQMDLVIIVKTMI